MPEKMVLPRTQSTVEILGFTGVTKIKTFLKIPLASLVKDRGCLIETFKKKKKKRVLNS